MKNICHTPCLDYRFTLTVSVNSLGGAYRLHPLKQNSPYIGGLAAYYLELYDEF